MGITRAARRGPRHPSGPHPRHHRHLTQADIPCWADKAYQGAGDTVQVPYRGRWENLSAGQQAVNRSHAKIRALGEQAMATLKTWRLLRKLRCSTTRITDLVKAVLSLHLAPST